MIACFFMPVFRTGILYGSRSIWYIIPSVYYTEILRDSYIIPVVYYTNMIRVFPVFVFLIWFIILTFNKRGILYQIMLCCMYWYIIQFHNSGIYPIWFKNNSKLFLKNLLTNKTDGVIITS